ncbi:MAG: SDR family oxidoreductase [Planctomycetaceae bacterium]|nr:SDR family oxidoreductase [Planctomycetaceae bacterium]
MTSSSDPSESEYQVNARGFASLDGLTAMVTGASTGIGRAIAVELGRAGAQVIVHCRKSVEESAITVSAVEEQGATARLVTADLSQPEQVSQLVEDAWAQFGPVNVWIGNAGADLLTGSGASLSYEDKLQRLLDVDVRGSILAAKLAGERMRRENVLHASILTIGWDQADRGMEGDSGELFALAKNAVMGFSRSLAVSLAPEVRVNCIAPGWIRTAWGENVGEPWQQRVREETPLARWGEPEDIAVVARFLSSPVASYLTGQVINVNGGAVR